MASKTLPEKRNKKAPRRAKAKPSCAPDGAQWGCYPELLLDAVFWIFSQETWAVMTLCCFWKYIPACQRKTQPEGSDSWWWWDPISALSLEPFRCDTPSVPSHDWSGLSNWVPPVWTCLWMTTSFLPKCVFSFSETRWQWQIEDENAYLYGVTVWCANRG